MRARLPTAAATSPLPAGAGAAPGRAGLGGGRRRGEPGSPSGAQGGRRRVSCRTGAVVAGSGVTAEGRAGSGSGRWAALRRAPEAGGEECTISHLSHNLKEE